MKKIEFFKIEGDRINRIRKHCPKCGPGVFLAEHKNRFSCGSCGYTEFKGGAKPPVVKEKPIEKPMGVKPETPLETSLPITDTSVEQPKKDTSSDLSEEIKEPSVDTSEPTDESLKEEKPEEKAQIQEPANEDQPSSSGKKSEKKTEEESKD